jgi:RNA polymerase sigma-70 factor (ECF subfamily)
VTGGSQPGGDEQVVARLRRGDAAAFAEVVDSIGPTMLRLALVYVGSRAVAEEVVQEAWIGVLGSLDRFEGRSTLRTWICAIAINAARKRGAREGRSVPVSALGDGGDELVDPDADRFFSPSHPRWAGNWSSAVHDWRDVPEERLLSRETRTVLSAAVARRPASQRAVFVLHDVEGWSGEEICNVLGLTGTNQRVLLHRARTRLRRALESYFDQGV